MKRAYYCPLCKHTCVVERRLSGPLYCLLCHVMGGRRVELLEDVTAGDVSNDALSPPVDIDWK